MKREKVSTLQQLNIGRMLLVLLFITNSCKQHELWPDQQVDPSRLTIAEAKAHFDKNFKKPFKIK